MRTLFVMDPLDRIQVEGDSTYVLMEGSTARGWPISWCTPDDLYVDAQRPRSRSRPVTAHPEAPYFRPAGDPTDEDLAAFDCIWMRKDPPFDMDYIFTTYILDLASRDCLILNDPASLKCNNEKMYALQWPDLCPPTRVTNRIADVLAFAEIHGRIVVKPWDGNGGRGVLVTRAGDPNLRSMAELLTVEETAYCIVQRYLPEIKTGDKRIILIDGEARGWFIRVPGAADHRGNMHVGASVSAFDLTLRDVEICQRLSKRLKAEGLLFVGIDIIGDYLTEINVTSPTGLREIARLQGRILGPELLDRAAELRRLQKEKTT